MCVCVCVQAQVCVCLFSMLIYYCLHVYRSNISSESPISLRYVKTYDGSLGWFADTGNCLEKIVQFIVLFSYFGMTAVRFYGIS